jgi:hypothetical protein
VPQRLPSPSAKGLTALDHIPVNPIHAALYDMAGLVLLVHQQYRSASDDSK